MTGLDWNIALPLIILGGLTAVAVRYEDGPISQILTGSTIALCFATVLRGLS